MCLHGKLSPINHHHSVTLNWEDRSTNEHGFKVYRSTELAGSYTEIATVTANVTNYTDRALSPGTSYFYKLVAFNDIGYSEETSVLEASTLAI